MQHSKMAYRSCLSGLGLVMLLIVGLLIWFFTNPYYRLRNGKKVSIEAISKEESLFFYYASIAMHEQGIEMSEMDVAPRVYTTSIKHSKFDWEKDFQEENRGLGRVTVQIKLGDPVKVYIRSIP